MKRRDFLKTSVIASAALSLNFEGLQAALSTNTVAVEKAPDMVAVMGGEPEVMLDKALEALGGIGNFVKKGQKIVIKPNIGWDRSPELAGNTNPKLVKALVKKCLEAGASKVTVFDHTCDLMDAAAATAFREALSPKHRALAAWMALCHDLGKMETDADKLPRHIGHENRHTNVGKIFRHGLQRDGFTRACSAGDQTMPIGFVWSQKTLHSAISSSFLGD